MQKKIKKAVILAGGKGTRLASVIKDTPKSLVKIGDKPVIEHQILLLKKYGIKDIWIMLGYLGGIIRKHLGNGKKWGVNIRYCQEKKPLGTAGALKPLGRELKEDFLVLSGDVMLDLNVKKFINWHQEKKEKIASFVVHPTDHPRDSDLIETDSEEKISFFFQRPHPRGRKTGNLGIASVFAFSPAIFKYIPKNKKTDIEKDILPKILKLEKVFAYNTPEYIKDMGTPERLKKVMEDYASGKIFKKRPSQNVYEA